MKIPTAKMVCKPATIKYKINLPPVKPIARTRRHNVAKVLAVVSNLIPKGRINSVAIDKRLLGACSLKKFYFCEP